MRLVASLLLLAAMSVTAFADQDTSRPRGSGPGRGGRPRQRTFTYFIEQGSDAIGYRSGDRELATWAMQAWERSSGGSLRFVAGTDAASRLRIKWVSPRSGQYGETRPERVGNRTVITVNIRPDTASLSPAIADTARADSLLRDTIVYLTCLHELGHAIGLTHTADDRDIMYSFQFGGDVLAYFMHYRDQAKTRAGFQATSGLSPHDVDRLRALVATR
jgi:hypothetical protein